MDNRRLDSKRYRKYQVRSDMRMGKIFLKPPSNRIDKIFFLYLWLELFPETNR